MNTFYLNFLAIVFLSMAYASTASDQPNVILVMTDDQGYGDLGCNEIQPLKHPISTGLAEKVFNSIIFM